LVRIEKGGDIIPDIQECVVPGEHDEHVDTCDLYQWPEHAYTDGVHLMLPEKFAYDTRLAKGIMGLNVDGLGGTTAWKITEHLKFMQSIKSVKYRDYAILYDLFYLIDASLRKSDPVQHLTTALGLSTYSKMDVKVAYGLIERFKTIHLSHFIECLRLPGVGGKVAYCTALELLGEKVDYFGLEKAAVDSIRHNTELIHFLDFMKHHENAFKMPVEQVAEKDDTLPTLYIVMTGSPKVAGYKTKGEFVNALNASVVGLVNIIDAGDKFNLGDTVLIAPSADATSNKAKGALNAGATILTYYDAVSTISTKYKK
jgi:NAD-dependent DNA ligase